MRVLVVGQGAREHALAWKLSKDSRVDEVICAPGNAGTAPFAENVAVSATDVAGLVALAKAREVGLVIVGPEAPLVAGLVDACAEAGIPAFGPSRAGARLEGSKVFSKELMARHGVPTAGFRVFADRDVDAAIAYVREANRPLVVKADGLAAGKGVVVASDTHEAVLAVESMLRDRAFGDAGARIVVEERLVGPEVSYHVVADGERYVALAPAQDHKRVFDADRGPNTGGMGAYSPPPMVTPDIERAILERVVEPTLAGMKREGAPFRGALFVGLMIVDGAPQTLEYNTRFGDPECECLMARWKGDVLPLLLGSATGDLSGVAPSWEAPAALSLVLASGGYPGVFEKGKVITGLDRASAIEGVTVFHAGTKRTADALVTDGGRVLTVTAIGSTLDEAADRAYRAADLIEFDGKHCRRDIGWQARTRAR
jgi:phosphoribosylamine--glycine ligase